MSTALNQQCPNCTSPVGERFQPREPFRFCPECQFPLFLIAGKYRLLKVIAEGGFGKIYSAQHATLKGSPTRAIKLLKATEQDERFKKRFFREVQLTAELSEKNNHIVRIYDDFGEAGRLGYYYVMEFLEGKVLRELLSPPHEALSLAQCRHLFSQLCSAIRAAHLMGIVHRDLKPENLFCVMHDRDPLYLKVLDFGIAKPLHPATALTEELTTGGLLGTPAYMAPEQCMGRTADHRADLYAMGLILYECLVGHHPFRGEGDATSMRGEAWLQAHVSQSPPPLSSHWPSGRPLPSGLDAVLQRALAKQPAQRYQRVEAFEEAVNSALGAAPLASIPSVRKTSSRPPKTPLFANTSALMSEALPAPPSGELIAQLSSEALPLKAPSPDIPAPEVPSRVALAPHTTAPLAAAPSTLSSSHPVASEETPLTGPNHEGRGRLSPALWGGMLALVVVAMLWRPWERAGQRSLTRVTGDAATTKAAMRPSRSAVLPEQSAALSERRPGPQDLVPEQRPMHPAIPRSGAMRRARPRAHPTLARRRSHVVPRRLRRRRRSVQRGAPKRWVRYVEGCPKKPLFWTLLRLRAAQLQRLQPQVKGGVISPVDGGLCVGAARRDATLSLGKVAKGFIPCTLALAVLPTKGQIVLQTEGMLEPTSTRYCFQKRK